MDEVGPEMAQAVREKIKQNYNAPKKNFINAIKSKVFFKDKERSPSLEVGNRHIEWLKASFYGEPIRGKVLVPINRYFKRFTGKRNRDDLGYLLKYKKVFFWKDNVLYMNYDPTKPRDTRISAIARAAGGRYSKKGGVYIIPVAKIVNGVRQKRRVDFFGVVLGMKSKLLAKINAVGNVLF